MRCSQCGQDQPSNAKFCGSCGARMGLGCPACRAVSPLNSKFCLECGASLTGAAVPASAAAASPEAYTPKHLAEKIIATRNTIEGERKQVTVLFADLKGSTELLADRDAEEARRLVDAVLERMMEAVHCYEGTVNQVMGDGIMALFGAPVACENHAVRACYAALRMQRSMRQYSKELRRGGGPELHARVGLNSGEVVVRSIQNDLHMDYTAVGATTHLAARMEQLARPGAILVTDQTFQLVNGFVEAQPLGPTPVKGVAEPVEIYEVLRAGQVQSRLQAAVARGLTPLTGREAELTLLREVCGKAVGNEAQVVALVGEPGVGKSRLLWEVAQWAKGQGWLVLEGTSPAAGTTTAYAPMIEVLKRFFGVSEGDSPRRMRHKVVNQVLARNTRLKRTIPALFAFLGIAAAQDRWRALDPAERQHRMVEAIRRLLMRESLSRPVLMAVEDLQAIDADTQSLLGRLIAERPAAPIVFLVSHRPEFQPIWKGLSYYTELRLEPLRADSAAELLDVMLGPGTDVAPLKRLLIERTEGNPLFLEESVRTLIETKVLLGEPGGYRLGKALANIQIPTSVKAVIATRIDRLAPEDKRLLQWAAVIGREIPLVLLEAVAELPPSDLRRALERLQQAGFLYEVRLFPDLEYAFRHPSTHEVVYAGLLKERRRLLHGRVLGAIEASVKRAEEEYIEQMAYHALRGESWSKAVDYLRRAGRKSVAQAANAEAVECFRQALLALGHLPSRRDSLERAIDLRLDLRAPLLQLGQLDEALTHSREAAAMAEKLGDDRRLAQAYTYIINYHYLKGEPEQVIAFGERCLEIGAAFRDLPLQTLARRYVGQGHHVQGAYRRAEELLKQNVEALEGARIGDDMVQAAVNHVSSSAWLGFTYAELGEFDSALTWVDRAQRTAESSGHSYSQAIARTLTGLVLLRRGQYREALTPLEWSLEACREKRLTVWEPIPASILGLLYVLLERVDEGLNLLREAVALSERLGVNAYLALWYVQLAEGLIAAGQLGQAATAAERGLELAFTHKEQGHQAWCLLQLGTIAAESQPPMLDKAYDYYGQAIKLGRELGMQPLVARALLGLARLSRRTGNRTSAGEHLKAAMVLFASMGMGAWLIQAQLEATELATEPRAAGTVTGEAAGG
jgi:class 3 adenylate cyclase/tetratricopeptide (TPR) repeat protein